MHSPAQLFNLMGVLRVSGNPLRKILLRVNLHCLLSFTGTGSTGTSFTGFAQYLPD